MARSLLSWNSPKAGGACMGVTEVLDILSGRVAHCWVMDTPQGETPTLEKTKNSKYIMCAKLIVLETYSTSFAGHDFKMIEILQVREYAT